MEPPYVYIRVYFTGGNRERSLFAPNFVSHFDAPFVLSASENARNETPHATNQSGVTADHQMKKKVSLAKIALKKTLLLVFHV